METDTPSRGVSREAEQTLQGKTLGISISDCEELASRGLTQEDLREALEAFSRRCLAQGAVLAYGGDLRPGGYSEFLFDLVRTHNAAGQPPFARVVNYLAWPLYHWADQQWIADHQAIARFEKITPPDDLVAAGLISEDQTVNPDTPAMAYVWARCLSAMRERMVQAIDARVILGGKLRGYKGKYPGIVEEALLAVRTGQPLFVLGGFGGAASAVGQALQGANPDALSEHYQRAAGGYAAVMDFYNAEVSRSGVAEPIDYAALNAEFAAAGIAGLNNGLNDAENRLLFTTADIDQAVDLVLKGLTSR